MSLANTDLSGSAVCYGRKIVAEDCQPSVPGYLNDEQWTDAAGPLNDLWKFDGNGKWTWVGGKNKTGAVGSHSFSTADSVSLVSVASLASLKGKR